MCNWYQRTPSFRPREAVNVLTETAFAFLPAIICWSAYKVFGGMPVIGLVIGLVLVSPPLPNLLCGRRRNSGHKAQSRLATNTHPVTEGTILDEIV